MRSNLRCEAGNWQRRAPGTAGEKKKTAPGPEAGPAVVRGRCTVPSTGAERQTKRQGRGDSLASEDRMRTAIRVPGNGCDNTSTEEHRNQRSRERGAILPPETQRVAILPVCARLTSKACSVSSSGGSLEYHCYCVLRLRGEPPDKFAKRASLSIAIV